MPFQPVEDVIEVRLFTSQNGAAKLYENVLNFHRAGGWTSGDIDSLLAYIPDSWAYRMGNYAPNEAALEKVAIRDLTTEFGYAAEAEDVQAGTDEATYLPVNCALFLQYHGSAGGAPRRGGTYWPFVPEAACDQIGELTSWRNDARDAWIGFIGDVEAHLSGVAVLHVIVSRYHKTVGATPPYLRDPAVWNTVASVTARAQVASQRARRT